MSSFSRVMYGKKEMGDGEIVMNNNLTLISPIYLLFILFKFKSCKYSSDCPFKTKNILPL
jgi:hypothetical protein